MRTLLEGLVHDPPARQYATRTARPNVWVTSRYNHSNDDNVRRTLAELPPMLDRIDAWIAAGKLDAANPGAADFMIAPTTRALMWFEDLRPLVERRPAGEHALRIAPHDPGASRRCSRRTRWRRSAGRRLDHLHARGAPRAGVRGLLQRVVRERLELDAQRELDQPVRQPDVLGQQRPVQVGADHVAAVHALEAVAAVVAVPLSTRPSGRSPSPR